MNTLITNRSNYMFFSGHPPQMLEEGDRRFNITNNGGLMYSGIHGGEDTLPQFQPLYKPDTKGNACVWSISVNDDSYTISHGKVGGKIQDKTTICAPKNVGRSNESTGSEQALKEAEAKWVHTGSTVIECETCDSTNASPQWVDDADYLIIKKKEDEYD